MNQTTTIYYLLILIHFQVLRVSSNSRKSPNYSGIINSLPYNTFVKFYLSNNFESNYDGSLSSIQIPTSFISVANSSSFDNQDDCKYLPVKSSKIALRSNSTVVIISYPQTAELILQILPHATGTRSYHSFCQINPGSIYFLLIHAEPLPLSQSIGEVAKNTFQTHWYIRAMPKIAVLYSFANKESFVFCFPARESNRNTVKCKLIHDFGISDFNKHIILPSEWEVISTTTSIKTPNQTVILDTTISLHSNLIGILFKKGNLTLTSHYTTDGILPPSIEETTISENIQSHSTSILIDTSSVLFLTCHTKPLLNFEMYIIPFQPTVWLALAITTSGIIAFTYCFIKLSKHLQSVHFCPAFFYLSFLVDDSYSAPRLLWKNLGFKLMVGVWSLSSLLLVNCYVGLMIMEVSSPLKGTKIKSYDDILCQPNLFNNSANDARGFWMLNYTMHEVEMTRRAFNNDGFDLSHYESFLKDFQKSAENCFTLLSSPTEPLNSSMAIRVRMNPRMYREFNQNLESLPMITAPLLADQIPYTERLIDFLSPQHRHYPNDPKLVGETQDYLTAAIEKELTECGLSIYLAERKQLLSEFLYLKLNYPRKRFYLGEDVFNLNGPQWTNWIFSGNGDPKIAEYFRQIFEAGIPDVLRELHFHNEYLVRRKGTELIRKRIKDETSVKMDGSIQTVFIIWCAGVTVSWFSIMMERMNVFKLNSCYLLCWKITLSCLKCYDAVNRFIK
jgi:hypothetical protein